MIRNVTLSGACRDVVLEGKSYSLPRSRAGVRRGDVSVGSPSMELERELGFDILRGGMRSTSAKTQQYAMSTEEWVLRPATGGSAIVLSF